MSNPEIPKGIYCYHGFSQDKESGLHKRNVCPHWTRDFTKPIQENGYCKLLGYGDWEAEGISLLWDMCKECGINEGGDYEQDIK